MVLSSEQYLFASYNREHTLVPLCCCTQCCTFLLCCWRSTHTESPCITHLMREEERAEEGGEGVQGLAIPLGDRRGTG